MSHFSSDASALVPPARLAVDVDLLAGRVSLAGALTRANRHHLDDAWSALSGGAPATWVLDLAALTFCDVAGVHTLQAAPRAAARAGASLVITGADPDLRQLLALVGLGVLLIPAPAGQKERARIPAPAASPGKACGGVRRPVVTSRAAGGQR